jgi:hypothetical protein
LYQRPDEGERIFQVARIRTRRVTLLRRDFRTVPAQVHAIEANLSIANMDFDELAGGVDESGVFRGFPPP